MNASLPAISLKTRLVLAWLALCAIWGSTYLVVKVAVSQMAAPTLVATRFTIAAAVMTALAVGARAGVPRRWGSFLAAPLSALFMVAGGNFLGAWAEEYLSSGPTALLAATGPLFVAVFQAMVPGRRRPGALAFAGSALGIAGVAILTGGGVRGADHPFGVLLALCSSAVWGAGTVYVAGRLKDWHPLSFCAVQFATGALMFHGVCWGLGVPSVAPLELQALAPVVYLACFGSGAATALYLFLLRHADPVRVTTFTYINPVVALLLGALFLGEPLPARVFAAVAVILLGVYAVEWEGRRSARAVRAAIPQPTDAAAAPSEARASA